MTYGYNLQGRLETVTTTDSGGTSIVVYSYDSSGNRVSKADDGVTTSYLVDSDNPTGYSQVLEERTNGSLSKTYTIGDDVLGQTTPTGTTSYLLYDGHGSTRQLLTGSAVSAVYDYDSYGIGTQTDEYAGSSNLQYTGEQIDTESGDYYLRARYYSPANGRFNRIDPYAGNTQDPQSLHKYLYCHANPVNGIDPSGMEFALANTLTVNALVANLVSISIPYVTAGMIALTATLALHMVYQLSKDYLAAGMTTEAAVITSNTSVVAKAIEDVAKALGKTIEQLNKMKLFPVIRSLTPKIYDFNVSALRTNPRWFMLTYNGVGSLRTPANRSWVSVTYKYMMTVAPAGYQLDEFPYACTLQGGRSGPAFACPVPEWENRRQGGLLGAFTRWTLKGKPESFVVVPIPL